MEIDYTQYLLDIHNALLQIAETTDKTHTVICYLFFIVLGGMVAKGLYNLMSKYFNE